MAKTDAGSRAVMSRRRKKDDNEGLTEEERLWKTLDFYATPPWAARAIAELMRELWPDAKTIREPACGLMNMAEPMAEYFPEVLPSDVYAYTPNTPVRDFFDSSLWPEEPDCDVISTNPPFITAADFLRTALTRSRMGVVLLVRTVWVESVDRYPLFVGDHPCTQIAFFSERVPMALGPWDPEVGSATSYAAMFWSHLHEPMPPRWIAPGTRARLSKRDDAMRFGIQRPMPLFPEAPCLPPSTLPGEPSPV